MVFKKQGAAKITNNESERKIYESEIPPRDIGPGAMQDDLGLEAIDILTPSLPRAPAR